MELINRTISRTLNRQSRILAIAVFDLFFIYFLNRIISRLASSVPDFDDLSKVEGMPQDCAWGMFDRDGQKDKVGTLNSHTPGSRQGCCVRGQGRIVNLVEVSTRLCRVR